MKSFLLSLGFKEIRSHEENGAIYATYFYKNYKVLTKTKDNIYTIEMSEVNSKFMFDFTQYYLNINCI